MSSDGTFGMDDVPDLDAINDVADPTVQFYAIIGASITAVSGAERALFRCYVAATNLSENEAAKIFYRKVQFMYKRDIADAAVRDALASDLRLTRWKEMIRRTQALLGPQGTRNLLGHNVVG